MPLRWVRVRGGIKHEIDLEHKRITFSADENLLEEDRKMVEAFGQLINDPEAEIAWEIKPQGAKAPQKPIKAETRHPEVEEKS